MMKLLTLLAILLLCSGCASMIRHSTSASYSNSHSYPYCGVVYDGCIIAGGLTGESISDSGHNGGADAVFSSLTTVLLGIADLPFSFCLDTVLLPYDIYKVVASEKEKSIKPSPPTIRVN